MTTYRRLQEQLTDWRLRVGDPDLRDCVYVTGEDRAHALLHDLAKFAEQAELQGAGRPDARVHGTLALHLAQLVKRIENLCTAVYIADKQDHRALMEHPPYRALKTIGIEMQTTVDRIRTMRRIDLDVVSAIDLDGPSNYRPDS